jgi:hypothetical protein
MSSRDETFKRLRAEAWTNDDTFKKALAKSGATLQSVTQGSGKFVYDEYSILVDAMPADTTPESFLVEMATDLNGTVNDRGFNVINKFVRKQVGKPTVGEVIHIDILGPDNGSVILAELKSDYFIFMTVETEQDGTHPEYGSREFGFEKLADGVTRFYTRGCSRTANALMSLAGAAPQTTGWTRLARGLSDTLQKRGGKPRPNSFVCFKKKEEETT